MKDRRIIYTAAILLLFCLSFLAYSERRQESYDYDPVWWAAYFTGSNGQDLSFMIENHDRKIKKFHWEVSDGKDVVFEGDADVAPGSLKEIEPGDALWRSDRINVIITGGGEKKEIYKTIL